MNLLALDAALARCSAALLTDGLVVAERVCDGAQGQASLLPVLAAAVLEQAGVAPATLDAVAVTVGPGSFTGLRAATALAHGLALASGAALIGVTVAEALAAALPPQALPPQALPPQAGRTLWVAIGTGRRGRIFLVRDGVPEACALDALPRPDRPVALAGDAAGMAAAWLAAIGADVMLTGARLPQARDVAQVALRRLAGALPSLPAQPLYVDAPEARLPAGGLRPPPGPG